MGARHTTRHDRHTHTRARDGWGRLLEGFGAWRRLGRGRDTLLSTGYTAAPYRGLCNIPGLPRRGRWCFGKARTNTYQVCILRTTAANSNWGRWSDRRLHGGVYILRCWW